MSIVVGDKRCWWQKDGTLNVFYDNLLLYSNCIDIDDLTLHIVSYIDFQHNI